MLTWPNESTTSSRARIRLAVTSSSITRSSFDILALPDPPIQSFEAQRQASRNVANATEYGRERCSISLAGRVAQNNGRGEIAAGGGGFGRSRGRHRKAVRAAGGGLKPRADPGR